MARELQQRVEPFPASHGDVYRVGLVGFASSRLPMPQRCTRATTRASSMVPSSSGRLPMSWAWKAHRPLRPYRGFYRASRNRAFIFARQSIVASKDAKLLAQFDAAKKRRLLRVLCRSPINCVNFCEENRQKISIGRICRSRTAYARPAPSGLLTVFPLCQH